MKRARWGVLGSWLTHYRAIAYQVKHSIPFQLTIEDDVLLRPHFLAFLKQACAYYERNPNTTVVQLSLYAEMRLQSLNGAKVLLGLLRAAGVQRVVDQQFLNPQIMGLRHSIYKLTPWRSLPRSERPFVLARAPNSAFGIIWHTPHLFPMEMALLRLATDPATARRRPYYGMAAEAV